MCFKEFLSSDEIELGKQLFQFMLIPFKIEAVDQRFLEIELQSGLLRGDLSRMDVIHEGKGVSLDESPVEEARHWQGQGSKIEASATGPSSSAHTNDRSR